MAAMRAATIFAFQAVTDGLELAVASRVVLEDVIVRVEELCQEIRAAPIARWSLLFATEWCFPNTKSGGQPSLVSNTSRSKR